MVDNVQKSSHHFFYKILMNDIDIIKELLRDRTPRAIMDDDSSYLHAAVLIPLFRENGKLHVILTKRTNRVEHHKGQISFPGGSVDEEDGSLKETALREAHEEIGLLKKDVEVLGQIDDVFTVASNFIVHPFVGLIPHPYPFRINPDEVESVIQTPLELFLPNSTAHKNDAIEADGMTYYGPVFQYRGEIIWGATARIMENLFEIIGEKMS